MTAASFTQRTLADLADSIRTAMVTEETARGNGFLQRVHPALTMFGLLCLVVVTVGSQRIDLFVGMLVLSSTLGAVSGVRLRPHLAKVAVAGVVSMLIVSPQAISTTGPVLGGLSITPAGLGYVGAFGLRVAAAVSLVALIPATIRFADIVRTLQAVRVPSTMVTVLALTHRYLVVSADELARMARGYRSRTVGGRGYRGSWRDASRVLGVFLLRVFERGEAVERAARARGGITVQRSRLDASVGLPDLAFAGIVLVVAAVGVGLV